MSVNDGYPLVDIQETMENHHFLWVNQLQITRLTHDVWFTHWIAILQRRQERPPCLTGLCWASWGPNHNTCD